MALAVREAAAQRCLLPRVAHSGKLHIGTLQVREFERRDDPLGEPGTALQRSRRAAELDAHADSRAALRAEVDRVKRMAERGGGLNNLSKVDRAVIKLGKKLL